MNTKTKLVFGATIALSTFWFAACQKDNQNAPGSDNSGSANRNPSSYVFPVQANMNGKNYSEWVAEWWKWNLQFDCGHFPIRDTTGSWESQNQSGPVYFLAGRRGHTLTVTIPADVSLFLPLATVEWNSTPNLLQAVTDDVNSIYGTSLTIDGVDIDVTNYKFISPVFNISANANLANCFDSDITGAPQDFMGGGYFVMLKPLSAGQHVIHRLASVQSGPTFDITYIITQL